MSELANYPRISPFLWFDNNADEAVTFYLSIFKNSRRMNVLDAENKAAPGKPMIIAFEIDGQKFTALNGGPMFKFNEAVSFVVRCESQEEIDEYWEKLTADGSTGRCGWLKDKFGLSWQVVPAHIAELAKYPAVMQAVMGMNKLDIAAMEAAAHS